MKKNGTSLNTFQFGAMKKKSLHQNKNCLFSNNNKEIVFETKRTKYIEMYYDLEKAYDSVIHSILIEKLKKKGIEKKE